MTEAREGQGGMAPVNKKFFLFEEKGAKRTEERRRKKGYTKTDRTAVLKRMCPSWPKKFTQKAITT